MSKMDPHDRIDLTGPWAGFGFQGGHMFTPEGHQLEPCDMAWWSLTCNIAREWRLMMAEASPRAAAARKASTAAKSSVIYLAEALRIRRERQFGVGALGSDAGASNVRTRRSFRQMPATIKMSAIDVDHDASGLLSNPYRSSPCFCRVDWLHTVPGPLLRATLQHWSSWARRQCRCSRSGPALWHHCPYQRGAGS